MFPGNPVAAAVAADDHKVRAARWRFIDLSHDTLPMTARGCAWRDSRGASVLTMVRDIRKIAYEFESEAISIS
jgi:hypothetical protein